MKFTSENIVSDNIAVFISGRGSNLYALLKNEDKGILSAKITFVYSNKRDAGGSQYARDYEKRYEHFPFKKENYERLSTMISEMNIGLIALAGFMRILPIELIELVNVPIVNIHPSLLPAFPGLDAQEQAFDHGVKISGATVHFVDDTLDGGPIIIQKPVDISKCIDPDEVSSCILKLEHELYTEAINLMFNKKWEIRGRRFKINE